MNHHDFVPPGHRAILGIPVIAAWPHDSGAWLSFQPVGPAIAILWRASDAWAATSMVVAEVCESLDFEVNYAAARRLTEELLSKGPPGGLLQSAERSRQGRSEKASKAANTRWEGHRRKEARETNGVHPSALALDKSESLSETEELSMRRAGPKHDPEKWEWFPHSDKRYRVGRLDWKANPDCGMKMWSAHGNGLYKGTRFFLANNDFEVEVIFENASLSKGFSVMEAIARQPPTHWGKASATLPKDKQ